MSLDVTNRLDLGGLVRLHLGWRLSKYQNFIGANATRFYLHILKMASWWLVSLNVQPMPNSLKILLSSFSNIAADCQSQNLCLSWIMRLPITQSESSSCVLMQESSYCTVLATLLTRFQSHWRILCWAESLHQESLARIWGRSWPRL